MKNEKTHLGDGIYIQKDKDIPDSFILTTEHGASVTNEIFLEKGVIDSLLKFVRASKLKKFHERLKDSK